MDSRNGAVRHPVRRPLSFFSALKKESKKKTTPSGNRLHKTSDIPLAIERSAVPRYNPGPLKLDLAAMEALYLSPAGSAAGVGFHEGTTVPQAEARLHPVYKAESAWISAGMGAKEGLALERMRRRG